MCNGKDTLHKNYTIVSSIAEFLFVMQLDKYFKIFFIENK